MWAAAVALLAWMTTSLMIHSTMMTSCRSIQLAGCLLDPLYKLLAFLLSEQNGFLLCDSVYHNTQRITSEQGSELHHWYIARVVAQNCHQLLLYSSARTYDSQLVQKVSICILMCCKILAHPRFTVDVFSSSMAACRCSLAWTAYQRSRSEAPAAERRTSALSS